MTARVHAVVKAMAECAEAPWSTTINIPFIIAGCTDGYVRPAVLDAAAGRGTSARHRVTHPIDGRMLRQEGYKRAIALRCDAVQEPNGVQRREEESRGTETLLEEGEADAVSFCTGTIASPDRSNGRTERGVKRRTDLTVPLDDIVRKCRRHGAARCHLSGALRTVGFS